MLLCLLLLGWETRARAQTCTIDQNRTATWLLSCFSSSNGVIGTTGSRTIINITNDADLTIDVNLTLVNVDVRISGSGSEVILNNSNATLTLTSRTNFESTSAGCYSWQGFNITAGKLNMVSGTIQEAEVGVDLRSNGILTTGSDAVFLNNSTHLEIHDLSQAASNAFSLHNSTHFASTGTSCTYIGIDIRTRQEFPLTIHGIFSGVIGTAVHCRAGKEINVDFVEVNTHSTVRNPQPGQSALTVSSNRTDCGIWHFGYEITNPQWVPETKINVYMCEINRVNWGVHSHNDMEIYLPGGEIRKRKKNFSVESCEITDFTTVGIYSDLSIHQGHIYIKDNDILSGNTSYGSQNNIGIHIEGLNTGVIDLLYNKINHSNGIEQGIRLQHALACEVNITENEILNPYSFGILMEFTDKYRYTVANKSIPTIYEVHGNTIINNTQTNNAIGVVSVHWLSRGLVISNIGKYGLGNAIEGCRWGINIHGDNRAMIYHNEIKEVRRDTDYWLSFRYPRDFSWGPNSAISFHSSHEYCQVKNNNLFRSDNILYKTGDEQAPFVGRVIGIYTIGSTNKLICSNNIENYTLSGVSQLWCLPTRYVNNTFKYPFRSVCVFNNGVIGEQFGRPQSNSTCTNCAVAYQNRFEAIDEVRLPALQSVDSKGEHSEWRVSNSAVYQTPTYSKVQTTGTWVECGMGTPGSCPMTLRSPSTSPSISVAGVYTNCSPNVAVAESALPAANAGPGTSGGFVWDAGHLHNAATYAAAPPPDTSQAMVHGADWQARQAIYADLVRWPVIRTWSAPLDTFYNEAAGSNMAKITELEMRFDSIARWSFHVLTYDTALADSVYAVDEEAFADRQNYIDSTFALNEALEPMFTIETNHKALNRLRLTVTLANVDTLTEGQVDSLKIIARQCPNIGGKPVFHARIWLRSVGVDSLDNVDTCDVIRLVIPDSMLIDTLEERKVPTVHDELARLSVYPNPAQDQLTVSYDLTGCGGVKASVISLDGRTVREMAHDSERGEFAIDLTDIPSGLYLLKLEGRDGTQRVVKFVVNN